MAPRYFACSRSASNSGPVDWVTAFTRFMFDSKSPAKVMMLDPMFMTGVVMLAVIVSPTLVMLWPADMNESAMLRPAVDAVFAAAVLAVPTSCTWLVTSPTACLTAVEVPCPIVRSVWFAWFTAVVIPCVIWLPMEVMFTVTPRRAASRPFWKFVVNFAKSATTSTLAVPTLDIGYMIHAFFDLDTFCVVSFHGLDTQH